MARKKEITTELSVSVQNIGPFDWFKASHAICLELEEGDDPEKIAREAYADCRKEINEQIKKTMRNKGSE